MNLKLTSGERFLYADLQIKAIHDACKGDGTADRVPGLLDQLPKDIAEIYSRALQKLCTLEKSMIEQTKRIFQWVICARRPMKISELEEAVTINTGQKVWKRPTVKWTWPMLSNRCGNLITYDDADGTVFLAHHSVFLFLKSCFAMPSIADFYFDPRDGDRHLGEICITYLNFTNFQKSVARIADSSTLVALSAPRNLGLSILPGRLYSKCRPKPFPNPSIPVEEHLRTIMAQSLPPMVNTHYELLDYCKTNWYQHCVTIASGEGNSFMRSGLRDLMHQELPFRWKPWGTLEHTPLPFWEMFNWAVHQGHTLILQVWEGIVSKKVFTDSWSQLWQVGRGEVFLVICARANVDVIDMLLNNSGFAATTIRHTAPRALVYASQSGHLSVVNRLLCEKPLFGDISTNQHNRESAEKRAVAEKRLLHSIADVNAYAGGERCRTAIQAAAEGGHLEVVERLLRLKADVNAASWGDGGRSALQAAAEGGHLAVVERLIQERADVNAPACDTSGRTALQAAAEGSHLAVVELLLQEKADVNAPAGDTNGRTALQAAAGAGHLEVLERLVQEGGDVRAPACGTSGRTTLQAAAEGGHLAVVERLLQEKTDVNAPACNTSGRTALQSAAEGGYLAMVERLLQEKADVNAPACGTGSRTALQAAAEGGHLAVVERLLQEKADVNDLARGPSGRTALQSAAEGGHLAVVERLLQEKADVNAPACRTSGRTALQAAAEGGHLAVVERLLQEQAYVNAPACATSGRMALQAAAEGGHLAVVERLLQEMADGDPLGDEFVATSLRAVELGAHAEVVERIKSVCQFGIS